MPVFLLIASLDILSLAGLVWLASHKSKTSSISATVHFCSLTPSPADAFCHLPIRLPSLPNRFFVVFCFATENEKITRLIREITCLLFPTFIEAADKGEMEFFVFLGGLSLHLNHLIGSRMGNYDWQFGTLPFGLFGSNLDTMGLETYPRTYSGHF